jgi:hypothetical protein
MLPLYAPLNGARMTLKTLTEQGDLKGLSSQNYTSYVGYDSTLLMFQQGNPLGFPCLDARSMHVHQ